MAIGGGAGGIVDVVPPVAGCDGGVVIPRY